MNGTEPLEVLEQTWGHSWCNPKDGRKSERFIFLQRKPFFNAIIRSSNIDEAVADLEKLRGDRGWSLYVLSQELIGEKNRRIRLGL